MYAKTYICIMLIDRDTLRALIKRKNGSVAEFCRVNNFNRSVLSNFLQEKKLVNMNTYIKYMKALDIEMKYNYEPLVKE